MKKAVTTSLILLFITTVHAQIDPRLRGLKIQIEKILEVTHTPGCAVAVVEGHKVLYAQGFGYRDYQRKIEADAHTVFPIGSVTKAFTAALLGQLRDKGKISFEENPLRYVPALKFYNEELNNDLIVQDLLTMRTGLALHDKAWSGIPVNDRDSLIRRIQYLEPAHKLRVKWNYSNFSYFTLGMIGEKLTGRTWEENVESSLLKPLRMNSSSIGLKGLRETRNVSLGYSSINGKIEEVEYLDLTAMAPAGGINSTAHDMANWLLAWINKGKLEGQQVLPEQYVAEAIRPHAILPAGYLPDEEFSGTYLANLANYGYGWILSDYKGHYRVEHGGSIDGFRASAAFFPDKNLGIVVLTNQVSYQAAMMIRNTLADKLLEVKTTDWMALYLKNQEPSQPPAVSPVNHPTAQSATFLFPKGVAGSYTNPGYGRIKLFYENGELHTYFRKRKLTIIPSPAGKDVFQAITTVPPYRTAMPPIHFKNNPEGEVVSLSIQFEDEVKPIEFARD
ncbi:serine hydrolase [Rufibacter latericius]|uniref:Serine hydrolase n=2 Tax=Rufibacter latericius TaxID=2487040 RepID=A0A3M9MU70_9BACT|nr:serine hydrolase [Rufibacter latericius]